MRTLTKALQKDITPSQGIQILKDGNERFVSNLKFNRNLLQQVNETSESQHPFAVVISCMDSRTPSELIFDQGLGDIFVIRIAGNVINEDIIGSAEFGCKAVGAKVLLVLGHTSCGAIKGAIENVQLGHLHNVTSKIRRCLPHVHAQHPHVQTSELEKIVTEQNIKQSLDDLRSRSEILKKLEDEKQLIMTGALYNLQNGIVNFFDK
jgi:carbonic anhydrase